MDLDRPATPRRPRPGALAAALVMMVAMGAAGCGGSGGGATSTTNGRSPITTFKGDPNKTCMLLTPAEVGSAVGVPVQPGRGSGGNLCVYNLTAGPGNVQINSAVSPQSGRIYDLSRSSMPGAQDLPGVGTKAFVNGNRAFVLRGDTLIVVAVNLNQPAATLKAGVTKLAQAVGSRG